MNKGDIVTMYHAGTNAFYEATIIRLVPQREPEQVIEHVVANVVRHVNATEKRQPGAIFLDIISKARNRPRKHTGYYNDLSLDGLSRRLKAAYFYPTTEQLAQLSEEVRAAYGDDLIEVGVSRKNEEFFIRLKAD